MAGFQMRYEHPDTRSQRFYEQWESGRFRDGELLSATQRAFREGYLAGYNDAEAVTPGALLGAAHPHIKAKIYAQELHTGKSEGRFLRVTEKAFRSGYMQFMRDAAEAWRQLNKNLEGRSAFERAAAEISASIKKDDEPARGSRGSWRSPGDAGLRPVGDILKTLFGCGNNDAL